MIAHLLALTMAAAAQVHATSFDLNCNGTVSGPAFGPKPVSWPVHFRVDLASMRYCEGKCSDVLRIQRLRGVEIVLLDGRDSDDRGARIINRETGVLTDDEVRDGKPFLHQRATCEPAPFSGFPAPSPLKF